MSLTPVGYIPNPNQLEGRTHKKATGCGWPDLPLCAAEAASGVGGTSAWMAGVTHVVSYGAAAVFALVCLGHICMHTCTPQDLAIAALERDEKVAQQVAEQMQEAVKSEEKAAQHVARAVADLNVASREGGKRVEQLSHAEGALSTDVSVLAKMVGDLKQLNRAQEEEIAKLKEALAQFSQLFILAKRETEQQQSSQDSLKAQEERIGVLLAKLQTSSLQTADDVQATLVRVSGEQLKNRQAYQEEIVALQKRNEELQQEVVSLTAALAQSQQLVDAWDKRKAEQEGQIHSMQQLLEQISAERGALEEVQKNLAAQQRSGASSKDIEEERKKIEKEIAATRIKTERLKLENKGKK